MDKDNITITTLGVEITHRTFDTNNPRCAFSKVAISKSLVLEDDDDAETTGIGLVEDAWLDVSVLLTEDLFTEGSDNDAVVEVSMEIDKIEDVRTEPNLGLQYKETVHGGLSYVEFETEVLRAARRLVGIVARRHCAAPKLLLAANP